MGIEMVQAVTSFTNGWFNVGGDQETAGYYFDRDRVYLKGLIKGTTIYSDAFTLPTAYRPPMAVYCMSVSSDNPSVILISPGGGVSIVTGTPTGWVNLSGVSFRISDSVSSVMAPVFTNGWFNLGGNYETAGYYLDRNRVYLKGLIKGTALNTSAFTLPSGYRPPLAVYGMGVSNDNPGVVKITTDGNVQIITGTATGWVSLNGISFRI